MSVIACDGVNLAVDRAGHGPPLILIHGSWSDQSTWDRVFAALAQRFDTIRYDRRGYGASQRPGVGPAGHVADLLALIRTLGLGRVLLVANSLGAVIALGAAVNAPEHVAQVIAHEPPLFDLLDSAPNEQVLAKRTRSAMNAAVEAVRSGNHARAAQIFVEEVSGATNAWPCLPQDIQQGFTKNAGGFLTDATPSEQLHLPLEKLRQLQERLVITRGVVSPRFLQIIAKQLCSALVDSPCHVFSEAGHVPHQTCPQDFTSAVLRFAASYLESHTLDC